MPEHRFSPLLHQSSAPFSHFVRHGNNVYIAGMVGQRADDGSLVSDDVAVQCEAMMNNLKTLLGELSLGLSNVLRTTICLTDYEDFEAIKAAHARHLHEPFRFASRFKSQHYHWVRRFRSTPSSGFRTRLVSVSSTDRLSVTSIGKKVVQRLPG